MTSTTPRIITIALAILALAVTAASATPIRDNGAQTSGLAGTTSAPKQDMRSPDTRDAARATTPSEPNGARPETAGNANVTTDAHRGFGLARDIQAGDAAPAQEPYYASDGNPTPPTDATRTVAADTGDGIARLPFVIALIGALTVGLGAGSVLHRLHARRRHATRLAT